MKADKLIHEEGVSSVLVKHGEELSRLITERDIVVRVASKGPDPTKVMVMR